MISTIVVISVELGFVVIMFLAMLLFYLGFKWARRVIHVSWCMIGVSMTLGWVLATLSWASCIVVNDACRTADAVLENPTTFNQTTEKFFPEEEYHYAKRPFIYLPSW